MHIYWKLPENASVENASVKSENQFLKMSYIEKIYMNLCYPKIINKKKTILPKNANSQ